MHKYELFLRISMLGKGKLSIFKRILEIYPSGVTDHVIDIQQFLTTLDLKDCYIKQILAFDKNYFEKTLNWLINQENNVLIAYCDLNYPVLLRQISAPPCLLFVKGNLQLLSTPQIAMVGSRHYSEYGANWARYFAGELASNGLTITSGLALGIDAICHRGALEVEGKTIAVLGSGLNFITPRTNYYLANDILQKTGLLISEFLPFEQARAEYFPRRNRIISGLSLGTFVVEASLKSGSLITARYALEQNRDVFALTGEIDNENYNGAHWLIKQGAYLVTSPSDILDHYVNYLSKLKKEVTSELSTKSILHSELFALIHHNPIPIDDIASQLNLSVSETSIKLLDMELEGLIKSVTGGYVRTINL